MENSHQSMCPIPLLALAWGSSRTLLLPSLIQWQPCMLAPVGSLQMSCLSLFHLPMNVASCGERAFSELVFEMEIGWGVLLLFCPYFLLLGLFWICRLLSHCVLDLRWTWSPNLRVLCFWKVGCRPIGLASISIFLLPSFVLILQTSAKWWKIRNLTSGSKGIEVFGFRKFDY